jgi:hypothetical protein
MDRAMSSVMRSEATAAPVAAEPERKSAGGRDRISGLPAQLLRMQRSAGNHAVAQTLARSPARAAIQRCGANCSCSSCGGGGHSHDEELLDEELGAGLLRSAVANRTA